MRLAIFTDSYKPQINGVVTQIANISSEFVRRGHQVIVIAPSGDGRHSESMDGGVKVVFLPSVALPSYKDYKITLPHSPRVFREMDSFRPDIIHVHTPFGVGWLGLRCAKRLHVPVVGTYHTLLPEFLMYLPVSALARANWAKQTTWKYTNFFYGKCDIVTTPTERMKDELSLNGLSGAVVLPNAIDFRMFNKRRRRNHSAKRVKIIYFGRVSYEKNIEVLLLALKHLLWKRKDASLSITGSGPAMRRMGKIAREQDISAHVHFSGALSSPELAEHVAMHDIFATASTIETQGLTILEAMAAGLPCVGPDFLAVPDSIRDGKNGFLFKPYDFVEAAAKIEKLASSPSLRKRMGGNAIETARKFSVNVVADQTEKLYTGLIRLSSNGAQVTRAGKHGK
ncbi:MAG: glycosyltransferase [Candidatus Diapherotrites archaeon]|uniref:Glycosyltransferase n=1 Tax=Candidatus Iainarchaeum sp. TaxID=3101447 RepID=A0A8T3YIR5_9ARCH|nr:glycosyltransferase [Candidatus Diapherotrites archaeon]